MKSRTRITAALVASLTAGAGWAQVAETRPANEPVDTQPAIDDVYEAVVLSVSGRVSYALVDEEGVPGAWQPAQAGDRLPQGTQIRTMLRSRVTLALGDDTIVLIERATLASIDEFFRTADTKNIRLGLGHGAIRAGVAETTLRSDMVIATPTATLSKRGTMGFRIEYERVTGRFRVSLDRDGLVEAMNLRTGRALTIGPGQYVTEAMMRWIETAKFDRFVPVVDVFGMTDAEARFNAMTASGLATVEPGGGAMTNVLTGRNADRFFADLARQRRDPGRLRPTGQLVTPPDGVINRPEGNFGTGGVTPRDLPRRRQR